MEETTRPTIFDEYLSIKPDKYTAQARKFTKAMDDGHWTHDRFSFLSDIQDYKVNASSEERVMFTNTLATVGNVECKVKLWWVNMGIKNIPRRSIIDLGLKMADTERIHAEAYERLLLVLGLEEEFDKVLELPLIKGREAYLGKHVHKYYKDSKKQFVYANILFTLFVENVSLFSQFYIILWFGRYKNMFKDTNQQVSYTKNEETIHANVGIWLTNTIHSEMPELFDEEMRDKVLYEAREALNWECKIIDWLVGDYEHEYLSAAILKELVKMRLNDSLKEIGYPKIFDIDPDLAKKVRWFNEEVKGNNRTDFFFQTPVDYSKGTVIDCDDLLD